MFRASIITVKINDEQMEYTITIDRCKKTPLVLKIPPDTDSLQPKRMDVNYATTNSATALMEDMQPVPHNALDDKIYQVLSHTDTDQGRQGYVQ